MSGMLKRGGATPPAFHLEELGEPVSFLKCNGIPFK